jgi:TolB protein
MQHLNDPAREIGNGEQASWSPSGESIAVVLRTARENYLSIYDLDGGLVLAPQTLNGQVYGLSWGLGLPDTRPINFKNAAEHEYVNGKVNLEAEDQEIIELQNVKAPYPEMLGVAIPSFEALREKIANELGWDAFESLDNVFRPLNIPSEPSYDEDWLFTGRAIELHENLLFSDWMKVVSEEFNGQIYWRIYLKADSQGGDVGKPLVEAAWDFEARYKGENENYQQGGKLEAQASQGYWLDITAIAEDYGWERLQALSNWRSFFQGARFNVLVFDQGYSWQEAMLKLYSAEAVLSHTNP